MKKITVRIKNLSMSTDFQGFEGKECDKEAENIDKNLNKVGINLEVLNKQYKPEYYMETNKEEDSEQDFDKEFF